MLLLSSGSLHNYGLNRVFALAREIGFDGIEVILDSRWDTRQADYLVCLSAKYELPVASLHEPFHSSSLQGWDRNLSNRLKRTVELAEKVGARLVVVHPPRRTLKITFDYLFSFHIPFPTGLSHLCWLEEELATFQARTPVTIALENMPCRRFGPFRLNGYHLNRVEELEKFERLTFDTTHWGTWRVNLLEIYERLAGRVAHVHLSNYNGREHSLLSDGCLPLGELLRRLRKDGYRGDIALELDPKSLHAEDEGKVRKHLQECISFCKEHYER